MQNALAHAGKSWRRIVTAFAQDDAEAARRQWRKVADQLRPKVPKLCAFLNGAEAYVLAHVSFPAAHRARLHSANPVKRLSGEINRRTEVVRLFPNEAALVRLIRAILLQQNGE